MKLYRLAISITATVTFLTARDKQVDFFVMFPKHFTVVFDHCCNGSYIYIIFFLETIKKMMTKVYYSAHPYSI